MAGHDKHAPPNTGAIVERLIVKQQNAPKPPEPERREKTCERCQFMQLFKDAEIVGKSTMLCNRFPPHITTIPTQGHGGRPGVATMTNFPSVNPTMWCWEFKEKPSTAGESLEKPT